MREEQKARLICYINDRRLPHDRAARYSHMCYVVQLPLYGLLNMLDVVVFAESSCRPGYDDNEPRMTRGESDTKRFNYL